MIGTSLRETLTARPVWRDPLTAWWFFWRTRRDGEESATPGRFRFGPMPFFTRRSDWCAVDEVAIHGEYDFVKRLLGETPAPRVLDLGANIGMFALQVFLLRPGAKVCSVEPGAATFQLLERNAQVNPGRDWRLIRAAAWSADGEAELTSQGFSTGARLREFEQPAAGTTRLESVPTRTLASLLRDAKTPTDDSSAGPLLHLIKMDIEGGESAVLAGQESVLERVDHLVVELHPDRCDIEPAVAAIRRAYSRVYEVPGRRSSKPLVIATRQELELPLFEGQTAAV